MAESEQGGSTGDFWNVCLSDYCTVTVRHRAQYAKSSRGNLEDRGNHNCTSLKHNPPSLVPPLPTADDSHSFIYTDTWESKDQECSYSRHCNSCAPSSLVLLRLSCRFVTAAQYFIFSGLASYKHDVPTLYPNHQTSLRAPICIMRQHIPKYANHLTHRPDTALKLSMHDSE